MPKKFHKEITVGKNNDESSLFDPNHENSDSI